MSPDKSADLATLLSHAGVGTHLVLVNGDDPA